MGRVLVVGGAGYIGSHMVLMLLEAGYSVVVYDDLSAGHRGAIGSTEFIKGSTANAQLLDRTLKKGFDAVFHFAAKINVADSYSKPAEYLRSSVLGIINLLEAMVANSCETLIFSSTAAVYGCMGNKECTEDDSLSPVSPYGVSKVIAENCINEYVRLGLIDSIIFRYFNAAGADPSGRTGERHDPETHLIPLAVKAALNPSETLELFGLDFETADGSCQRDFVHVNDICEAHMSALRYLREEKQSGTFNLGSGRAVSVLEVIECVEEICEAKIKRKVMPRREGDPPRLVANIDKAKGSLSWTPKRSELRQIIMDTLNFHKSQLEKKI